MIDLLRQAFGYIADNQDRFGAALWLHVRLSGSALLLSALIFLPLGVLTSRSRTIGPQIVALVGAMRVVPSLAVLFLLLPWLGTGFTPALIALTLLAGPPLIVNADAGLRGVDPAVIESAHGLGMTGRQVFTRIRLPLALPVILAGLRTAAVETVASATLAAFIGAGGLGTFILSGMSLVDYRLLLVGGIPVTMLALGSELLFDIFERRAVPPS